MVIFFYPFALTHSITLHLSIYIKLIVIVELLKNDQKYAPFCSEAVHCHQW
jgi:hypothetical protein